MEHSFYAYLFVFVENVQQYNILDTLFDLNIKKKHNREKKLKQRSLFLLLVFILCISCVFVSDETICFDCVN